MINRLPAGRYLTRREEFRFIQGSLGALRRLRRLGLRVIVLSNQAGVGKRQMPRRELDRITRGMLRTVRRHGGRVDAVYYCTHRPQARCPCRKPRTGLLRRACRRFRLDPAHSFVVGDDRKDIRMGQAAGCATVLVLSGVTSRRQLARWPSRPDHVAPDLLRAVRWIGNNRHRYHFPGGQV